MCQNCLCPEGLTAFVFIKYSFFLISGSPDVVRGPPDGGEEEGANVTKDLGVEPRLAEDGVAEGGDVSLAQHLRHVLGVEDQVVPRPEGEGEERVPERAEGRSGNGSWAEKLVQIFLPGFVGIFPSFAEVVDQS